MTWTPKIKQVETWTTEPPLAHVFDPAVFDPKPIYDTGSATGIWTERPKDAELWTRIQ